MKIKWESQNFGDMIINSAILNTLYGSFSLCQSISEDGVLFSINNGQDTEYFETIEEFNNQLLKLGA